MGPASPTASAAATSAATDDAPNKIRVLVADDHGVILRGCCDLLESNQTYEIVGVATTGPEAVSKALETRPNVAVLDINMPGLNGVEATRKIRSSLPETEVLILTAYESEQLARAVLGAGAKGYLLKSDAAHDLVLAVESLSQGRPFFTTSLAQDILRGYLDAQDQAAVHGNYLGLTPHERQIVQLLAEGCSNKEVAARQGISVKTAETHRANIMRKLGFRSISDVIHFAVRNHIAGVK